MNQQFVLAPQPTMKRVADLEGPDFYPTPKWATHVLADNENFCGDIWECACGDGAMAEVLKEKGNTVQASDLYDRNYGEAGVDFRNENRLVENIVTNPPFHSAEEFVHAGLRQTTGKLAFYCGWPFWKVRQGRKQFFPFLLQVQFGFLANGSLFIPAVR